MCIRNSIKVLTAITFVLSILLSSPAANAQNKGLVKGLIGIGVGAIILNELSKSQSKAEQRSRRRSSATAQSGEKVRRAIAIQSSLNKLGYQVGPVDGVIGKGTRAGIALWQQDQGYDGTGRLTTEQYNELTGRAPRGIAGNESDSGDRLSTAEVRQLQQALRALGYATAGADGKMGSNTRRSLNAFLSDRGRDPQTTTNYEALLLATKLAGIPSGRNKDIATHSGYSPSSGSKPVELSPTSGAGSAATKELEDQVSDLQERIANLKKSIKPAK